MVLYIYFIIRTFRLKLVYEPLSQTICNDLYQQKYKFTQFYTIPNVFDENFCKEFIKYSEDYAKIYGWTKTRHKNYPTTDNLIISNWKHYYLIFNTIVYNLFPHYVKKYGINESMLEIGELFVVKYNGDDVNSQNSLSIHRDVSEFSFVIALNSEFQNGGTYFPKIDKTVHLKTGDALIFCGQTKHSGSPTTKGIRYILTGFLRYGRCAQQIFTEENIDKEFSKNLFSQKWMRNI